MATKSRDELLSLYQRCFGYPVEPGEEDYVVDEIATVLELEYEKAVEYLRETAMWLEPEVSAALLQGRIEPKREECEHCCGTGWVVVHEQS